MPAVPLIRGRLKTWIQNQISHRNPNRNANHWLKPSLAAITGRYPIVAMERRPTVDIRHIFLFGMTISRL